MGEITSLDYPKQENIGEVWEYLSNKGEKFIGKIKSIARVRSGAVLCFLELENGRIKGCPITKYGSWRRLGSWIKNKEVLL